MASVIVKNSAVLSGEPVFRGTRVPCKALTDYLEGGESLAEFLEQYPSVTREAAIAALEEARVSLMADLGMKVLINECAPKALKVALAASGFHCTTVQEAGWSGKENGELLALADASFDVVVTIAGICVIGRTSPRARSLLIVRARSNRVVDLEPLFSACAETLRTIQPGTVVEVGSSA
jgi:uncharacterized protein (DUF433 family)